MKRALVILVVVFVGVPIVAIVAGMLVPREHVARVMIELKSPPDRVWALISDFENAPKWRTDLTGVIVMPGTDGKTRFTESSSQGDVPFEVVTQEPPRLQVVRVIDDNQPFGGTWTWEIAKADGGTRVILTEAGFVKNPLFRILGLIFFRPTDSIRSYLQALAKALGETAEPRELKY